MGMSALASSRYVLSAMVVSRVFSRSAHGHLPEWVLVRGPLSTSATAFPTCPETLT